MTGKLLWFLKIWKIKEGEKREPTKNSRPSLKFMYVIENTSEHAFEWMKSSSLLPEIIGNYFRSLAWPWFFFRVPLTLDPPWNVFTSPWLVLLYSLACGIITAFLLDYAHQIIEKKIEIKTILVFSQTAIFVVSFRWDLLGLWKSTGKSSSDLYPLFSNSTIFLKKIIKVRTRTKTETAGHVFVPCTVYCRYTNVRIYINKKMYFFNFFTNFFHHARTTKKPLFTLIYLIPSLKPKKNLLLYTLNRPINNRKLDKKHQLLYSASKACRPVFLSCAKKKTLLFLLMVPFFQIVNEQHDWLSRN
jgi:hypothetical protein